MADTTLETTAYGTLYALETLWGPYWYDEDNSYVIYIDATVDLNYAQTSNNWVTSTKYAISGASTVMRAACWYDRETPGDSGSLLHIVWLDLADSALYYQPLDLSNNTLGTKQTVASGLTVDGTTYENRISVTKTRSGNLIVAFNTNTETGVYRSTDGGLNWSSRADLFESGALDRIMLFPANTGDDDDAAAIFHDASASQYSIKMYDESANTWAETVVGSNFIFQQSYRNHDGAIRHSDGHLLFAAWNNLDDLSADIETFDITLDSISSPSVTAKSNPVNNNAESGQVAIFINQQNDDVYVGYLDGGTWGGSVSVKYTKSTDGMDTWLAGGQMNDSADDDIRDLHAGRSVDSAGGAFQIAWFHDDFNSVVTNRTNRIIISAVAGGDTGQIKAKIGGALMAKPVKVKTSGSFLTKPLKYKSSGSFIETNY